VARQLAGALPGIADDGKADAGQEDQARAEDEDLLPGLQAAVAAVGRIGRRGGLRLRRLLAQRRRVLGDRGRRARERGSERHERDQGLEAERHRARV
jgi:hypothetical protein